MLASVVWVHATKALLFLLARCQYPKVQAFIGYVSLSMHRWSTAEFLWLPLNVL